MKSHTHKPLACLCLPNHVDWKSTPAGKCLQSIGKYPVWLQQSHSIVYNRTMCVKSNPGKDLLFVDQDMTFTEEDIKAVAHGDITGGKYNSRDGTPCYEEDWIGAGFLFVSGEVFERVPFPWFDSGWRSETEFESEDQYFCRKAIKAGFEINQVQCPTLKHHITEEGTMQQSQDGNRSTTINPEAIAGQCISECTNSIGEMKKVLIFLIQTIKRLQDENNELKVRNQNLEKTKTTTPKTKKM